MTTFERIKKLAKIRGLSLQQVAIKAGLSKNMIYQYRNGTNPSISTLEKIAKALNVNKKELLGQDDTRDIASKVDLDDEDTIFTYQGKPIPPEDMKIIKRLLNSDDD